MERITLADTEEWLKVLWYGEPGTGKTTESATMARLGRIVHVDAEAGLKRKPMIDHGIPVANIEIERDITFKGLEALGWELREQSHDGNGPIGVVLDSTSEIHKKLLVQTAERTYTKRKNAGMEYEENFVALEDYGMNANEMRKLIRLYRDLPMHVAFVCLERRDQDDNTGEISHGPDLTPKLQEDLAGYVDVICHTYCEEVDWSDEPEYWGDFRPRGTQMGKDRYHSIPPRLINPSFDRIKQYIDGDLDAESDPDMEAAREARRAWKAKADADGPPVAKKAPPVVKKPPQKAS